MHYETLTKPHSQHDEIYDRLSRLDVKIERIEKEISVAEDSGYLVGEAVEKVTQAKLLRNQAESAWDSERYSEADKFIDEAHVILDQIDLPPPTTVMNWWLIGGIIAAVVVIAVVISVSIRRRVM